MVEYKYTLYKCQEDSMSNSTGGFSVYATCALQPHRTNTLPKNISHSLELQGHDNYSLLKLTSPPP